MYHRGAREIAQRMKKKGKVADMIIMEDILQKKKEELESLINLIEKNQTKEPTGSLRIVRDGHLTYFYHYLPDARDEFPGGKYISKKDLVYIRALAQKDYNKKVIAWAKECQVKLEKLIAVYRDDMCLKIYDNLGQVRKELVVPYELPSDMLIKQWLNAPYAGKEIDSTMPCFITEKGEKVRSKSEKILADHFCRKDIPYKYECPLSLTGYGVVYPDFTLLNKRTRKIWYWEHLGMLDNSEYVQKSIAKIQTYERNGIFPGKQLLLSYELKNNLNMDVINIMMQEYLM